MDKTQQIRYKIKLNPSLILLTTQFLFFDRRVTFTQFQNILIVESFSEM